LIIWDEHEHQFDAEKLQEVVSAFHKATGLGCAVTDVEGKLILEAGQSYKRCELCRSLKKSGEMCEQSHRYGAQESERFGGKYVYYCPLGLVFFVTPVQEDFYTIAKVTAGPFMMMNLEDFLAVNFLEGEAGPLKKNRKLLEILRNMPQVEPAKADGLLSLLFYAVSVANGLMETQRLVRIQQAEFNSNSVNEFARQIKDSGNQKEYPMNMEQTLIRSIVTADKPEAQRVLNEILGYIFFESGGHLLQIKSRMYELIVVISRAAIQGGADTKYTFSLNSQYLQQLEHINDMNQLCYWLGMVLDRFMDNTFRLTEVKHADSMYKMVQYIREHYAEKITLETLSQITYLTPTYISKLFKQELGCNFVTFLNRTRIEKSKELLLQDKEYRLADIAQEVGFEDQSYFTKVFKRWEGVAPNRYRECRCNTEGGSQETDRKEGDTNG